MQKARALLKRSIDRMPETARRLVLGLLLPLIVISLTLGVLLPGPMHDWIFEKLGVTPLSIGLLLQLVSLLAVTRMRLAGGVALWAALGFSTIGLSLIGASFAPTVPTELIFATAMGGLFLLLVGYMPLVQERMVRS